MAMAAAAAAMAAAAIAAVAAGCLELKFADLTEQQLPGLLFRKRLQHGAPVLLARATASHRRQMQRLRSASASRDCGWYHVMRDSRLAGISFMSRAVRMSRGR
jgi:hypothetical protein